MKLNDCKDFNFNLSVFAHHLECLELFDIKLDLNEFDPSFENLVNLQQVYLIVCSIGNTNVRKFFRKLPNLEKLKIHFRFDPQDIDILYSLGDLKNLKFLCIDTFLPNENLVLKNLDFLKEMTSLIYFYVNIKIDLISDDTFKTLTNLRHLTIQSKSGNWIKHLTQLRSLSLYGLYEKNEDFVYDFLSNANCLTLLENLKIFSTNKQRLKADTFKEFKQLKSLRMDLLSNEINVNVFEGLENLRELTIKNSSFLRHSSFGSTLV